MAYCSIFYFAAATAVVAIALLSAMIIIVLAPHISFIISGYIFFAIRSDPINIGQFIGNQVCWPISDRNRISFRYATLMLIYSP